MSEPLDRDEVLSLLERLGGADDADVLAAARHLHRRVGEAELAWDDLLVDGEDVDDDGDEFDDDDDEDEDDLDEEPDFDEEARDSEEIAAASEEDAEILELIEKLLARADISDDFRGDLADYKEDIRAGEFGPRDRRYIRALHAKLSK